MTISYRMLAAIVGVVLLFGVAAAVLIGDDDDDGDTASATTVTVDRNDDGGVKTEDDEDTTTSTTRASTTTTTAGATTTSTTAAPGATTSTTRAGSGGTTTTRPRSTTTTPPATTAPTNPQPTNPPPTSPPTTGSNVADLGIHSNSSATSGGRRVTLSIENQGPSEDVDFTLTVNGGGAAVDNVEAGSGFTCNTGGSTVTCTARGVGQGGTVRQVTIDFAVDTGCTGQPNLSANVSSSNRTDPAPADNSYVRSLCRAAPNN